MSEEKHKIIIDLVAPFDKSLNSLLKYRSEIDRLRKSNEELRVELQQGKIGQEQFNASINSNNATIRQYYEGISLLKNELTSNIRIYREYETAIDTLNQKINQLTTKYKGLTQSQKESAEGEQMQLSIQALGEQASITQNKFTQFKNAVGTFEQSMITAVSGGKTFIATLLSMALAGTSTSTIIKAAGVAMRNFGKAMLADPTMAIVAGVAVAFQVLKKAVESNDEATARWKATLAPLSTALNVLMSYLQIIADWVLKLVGLYLKLAMAILKIAEYLPWIGNAAGKLNEMVAENTKLEKENYNQQVKNSEQIAKNAKKQKEIAEFRKKSQQDEKYSEQERLKFLEEAVRLEKELLQEEVNIKKSQLDLEEKREKSLGNTYNDMDKLNQFRADLANAETQQINQGLSLDKEVNAFKENMGQQEKRRHEEAQARINERVERERKAAEEIVRIAKEEQDKELTAKRMFEDSELALLEEGLNKQTDEINYQYKRRIEDLKEYQATEANLTPQAHKYITDTIENLEKERDNRINTLKDNFNEENLAKEAARIEKTLELRLELAEKGSEEELELRLQALAIQREAEIAEAEKLGLDVKLIRDKYAKHENDERLAADKAIKDKILEEDKLYWEVRLQEALLNGESEIQVKLEQKRLEQEQLTQLDEESDLTFLLRKEKLNNEILDLERQRVYEILQIYDQAGEITANFFGAASSLFDSFKEKDTKYAKYARNLALFEVGINTARAIAQGVVSALHAPFPASLFAIGTMITTVMANMATSKQILDKHKEPQANFATGGFVSGPGSGISDSIPANLSNGESVLTARATSLFAPVISAFNQIGGGVPIVTQNISAQVAGEEMLTRAFARALENMPNPRVAVTEIAEVQKRVELLENSVMI